MSVPALRFKDEAGRDFPEWSAKSIGELGKFIGGGTPTTQNASFWNGNIPWISSSDLSDENIYQINTTRHITQEAISQSATKLVPKNSILIVSRVGVGKVAITTQDICTSQDFTSLTLHSGSHIFFAYLIKIKTNKLLEFNQGTSIKGFVKSDLESLEISVPKIPEQTKIASFLTAVDEKIHHLAQKNDLLTQYKKGVMQHIFSQALRFKDDDGQDFPEWEETNLSEIAQIVGGGTPDTSVAEYWQGNVQWFTPTEIKTKYATNSLRTITESGLKNSSAKVLPVGTLLFSSRATVGDVSIALNECTTNQGFQSMIVGDKNNNEFIYYWISNNKKAFLEKASGSTFLEISKKEIEKLPVQRPCINEQTKIANFLTAIDDKITATKTQLQAVKQYKQGLLQQMFV